MVREDILAGLKNAIERGSSLESAIQSFVNAGYRMDDVHEAASLLNNAMPAPAQSQLQPAQPQSMQLQSSMIAQPLEQQLLQLQAAQAPQPAQSQLQPAQREKPKGSQKKTALVVLLSIALLILLGFLLFLLLPVFSEQREAFFGIFS